MSAVVRSLPMTDLFESPRNEVVIKFKNLSNDETAEIETFLKAQPDVKELSHRIYTMDHAPEAGTLGLILAQWDLVVVVSDSIKEAAPYVAPLLIAFLAARRQRMEKDKETKKREDEDTELVPLVDGSGRTITVVKRFRTIPRSGP